MCIRDRSGEVPEDSEYDYGDEFPENEEYVYEEETAPEDGA